MPMEQLLGPLALTVGLIIAVGVLWRLVIQYIAELRTSRDRWREQNTAWEPRFEQQTDALKTLSAAVGSMASTLERIERRLDK